MRMTGAFSMFAFIIMAFARAKASAERMEEVFWLMKDLNGMKKLANLGALLKVKSVFVMLLFPTRIRQN